MKLLFFLCLSSVALLAAEPAAIVEVESEFLIGAHAHGKWLTSKTAAKSVKPGTTFRLYGLTRELGTVKGGKPVANTDVCEDVYTVALSPKPEHGVIALAAPWNALPRVPRIMDATQPVYLQAARELLQGRGIREPKVKITKIVRIDLEGDGEDEVLISATNYFTTDGVPSSASAGSYSFVMLRRVVAGKVRTQLINGEIYSKAKVFNAPSSYEIAAILDLDGDGKLEVVIQSNYYEGGATTIYRCTPAKIEELVTVACGA
jgi:hypothetical protein